MARLRSDPEGEELSLTRETLVGRSAECTLRLQGHLVSKRHASISWTGQRWELRDLGSKNGTFLCGSRLEPGHARPIAQDQWIDFGGQARWTLVDERPPSPSARALDTGALICLERGTIALPSAEEPMVLIREHPRLGWIWEDGEGELDAARDGQVLVVGGRPFRLELDGLEPTRQSPAARRPLGAALLRLTVSADQENVDLELVWPDHLVLAPASTHWYIILLLARARRGDEDRGTLPARERGWVYRDELVRQLRTTVSKLNVDLHRLRGLLARIEVEDPAALYERRSSTGQIRLGTAAIEILDAAGHA